MSVLGFRMGFEQVVNEVCVWQLCLVHIRRLIFVRVGIVGRTIGSVVVVTVPAILFITTLTATNMSTYPEMTTKQFEVNYKTIIIIMSMRSFPFSFNNEFTPFLIVVSYIYNKECTLKYLKIQNLLWIVKPIIFSKTLMYTYYIISKCKRVVSELGI